MHGKMAIVSSAFESSLSLAAYVQFAHYLEQQNEAICKLQNREFASATAHGLGTYRWLKNDVTRDILEICVPPRGDVIEAAIKSADSFLRNFKINHTAIRWMYSGEQAQSYQLIVDDGDFCQSFKLLETGNHTDVRFPVHFACLVKAVYLIGQFL